MHMLHLCYFLLLFACPVIALYPDNEWHLVTRCRAGDINALFQYRGVWHLMHQWEMALGTAVGHQVSTDLVHWRRIVDALPATRPGPEGECYDGSVSLIEAGGVLQPLLMIDGGCGKKGPGDEVCMESTGNDTGGIIAFPADLDDPFLTNWTKQGPTVFKDCNGSSGPSPVWKNGDKYNLIAIHPEVGEARFESTDATFLSWKMVDRQFMTVSGGGGGLWHELPPNVDGVKGDRWPTHIFQAGVFVVGVYNPSKETFTNVTTVPLVDTGAFAIFGQLSHSKTEKRVFHVNWLLHDKGPNVTDCLHDGTIASLRDMRFDPRLDRLVENPIAEYAQLRSHILFEGNGSLHAGDAAEVLYTGHGGATMDMEIAIHLPPKSDEFTVNISTRCSNVTCTEGAHASFTISPFLSQQRQVAMKVVTFEQSAGISFPLLREESVLPIRIMSDRRTVEIFAGGGRGVFSGGMFSEAGQVVASVAGADVEWKATGWAMSSIYRSSPGEAASNRVMYV